MYKAQKQSIDRVTFLARARFITEQILFVRLLFIIPVEWANPAAQAINKITDYPQRTVQRNVQALSWKFFVT